MDRSHWIGRQLVEVEVFGTEFEGLAVQRAVLSTCRTAVPGAVERALDRCSPPEVLISVDRLEVDLGILSFERLEEKLAESIEQGIEESLRGKAQAVEAPRVDIHGASRRTTQERVAEAFLFFLETGRLPWSFRLETGTSLEQTVEQVLLREGDDTGGSSLRSPELLRVLDSWAARRRLVAQYSTSFLRSLLGHLSAEAEDVVQSVASSLRSSSGIVAECDGLELRLWEQAFSLVVQGHEIGARQLVRAAWHAQGAKKSPALREILERNWAGITDGSVSGPSLSPEHWTSAHDAREVTLRRPGQTDEMALGEGIYLDNAGLVLLHPFLEQLFSVLGVVEDERLVRPWRALCLLHYLATGQPDAPEYELVLPKILCNLPLEAPIEPEAAGLTPGERQEADAVLEAAVTHWQALGDSSPDSLRGTFLLRPGKLSRRDDGEWLLQVERRGFDVLLDELPWPISMIQLPWMDSALHVEWS